MHKDGISPKAVTTHEQFVVRSNKILGPGIHKKQQNSKIRLVPEGRQMDYLSLSDSRQIN